MMQSWTILILTHINVVLMKAYCCVQWILVKHSLRKHAYSHILKILQPKTEHFQMKKNLIIFFVHIPAQNIDCGYSLEPPRRGGSNYPQSMF